MRSDSSTPGRTRWRRRTGSAGRRSAAGSDRAPSHQVPRPSSTLVFHTAEYANTTSTQVATDRDAADGRRRASPRPVERRRWPRHGVGSAGATSVVADGFHLRHRRPDHRDTTRTAPARRAARRAGEAIVGGYPHGPCLADCGSEAPTARAVREALGLLSDVERGGVHRARPATPAAVPVRGWSGRGHRRLRTDRRRRQVDRRAPARSPIGSPPPTSTSGSSTTSATASSAAR